MRGKEVDVQGQREENQVQAYFHPQACHVRECLPALREVHEPEVGRDGDAINHESAHRAVQMVCGLCSRPRCLGRPSRRGYSRCCGRVF